MACRGVHFALTEDQREQLLDIVESQGDVINFIHENIEEQWDTDWLCETDKAWDAIHRCLTDCMLSDEDSTPSRDEVVIPFADVVALQLVGNGPFLAISFASSDGSCALELQNNWANIAYWMGQEIYRINIAHQPVRKRARNLLDSIARIGSFAVVEIQ